VWRNPLKSRRQSLDSLQVSRRDPYFQDRSILSGQIHTFRTDPYFQDRSILSGQVHTFRTDPYFQDRSILSGQVHTFRTGPYFQHRSSLEVEWRGSGGGGGVLASHHHQIRSESTTRSDQLVLAKWQRGDVLMDFLDREVQKV
jgi:hypothetical protein